MQVVGSTFLISGAASGLGAATAKLLVAGGARVVLAARKLDGVRAVADSLGDAAHAVAAHTGREAECAALVAAAIERYGRIDVLVNNAATNPYFGPMLDVDMGAWQKTFEVNLQGYFWMARGVARHLRDRGAPGSIVSVSSVAGVEAAPMQGVYGMTKAAVISMTQTLAQELGGSNIRVNAIAPGLVDTKFASAIVGDEDMRKHVVERTALNRHAQPDEIAGAAVFLASQASSYVTGQVLVVDGGTITTT